MTSHMEDAIRFVIDRELYTNGYTRTHLARAMGVPSSTIKRRMEGSGPGGALDALVSAASTVVGIPPVRMWRDALDIWERRGDDPDVWAQLRRGQAALVAQKDNATSGQRQRTAAMQAAREAGPDPKNRAAGERVKRGSCGASRTSS